MGFEVRRGKPGYKVAIVVAGWLLVTTYGGCCGRHSRRAVLAPRVPSAACGIDGQAGLAVGCYRHSRFHPVPCRPAFLPRADDSMMIDGQWYPNEMRPADSDSQWLDEPIPGTRPELIPAPSDGSTEIWKGEERKQYRSPSGGPSWVFSTPTVDRTDDASGQTPRVGLSLDQTTR